jgi:hypothetical protein
MRSLISIEACCMIKERITWSERLECIRDGLQELVMVYSEVFCSRCELQVSDSVTCLKILEYIIDGVRRVGKQDLI